MNIPMLDVVRMHAPLRDRLIAKMTEVLDSGAYIGGRYVADFEAQLAAYTGAKRVIGVSSGTDALLVALMALGLQPGDEVITTAFTFFATAGSIARLGAKPVFVDIDPVTFNIDPQAIDAAITKRTKGIIPVDLFGQSAEMDRIEAIAAKRGLWVLEDAAQSIGALHHGRMCGAMGTVAAYSFYPAKNLGAIGDAGAVLTNNEALAAKIDLLRNHGSEARYYHRTVGGNFRLDAIQAATLAIKLPSLKTWEVQRRQAAQTYAHLLKGSDLYATPVETSGNYHVYNQYELRVRNGKRDAAAEKLRSTGIGHAIYYPVPLHLQECFASLGYKPGALPHTEQACKEVLAVPILVAPQECERVARELLTV